MDQARFTAFDHDTTERPPGEAAAVVDDPSPADTTTSGDATVPPATGTIDLAVMQVNYTIDGSGPDEHPIIHVFGRTPDDTHEHVRVLGVNPYFYVPTSHLATDPAREHDAVVRTTDTDPDGNPYQSIRGEPLTRIIARTPRDVGRLRDEYDETYEADILFPNRFLIDHAIRSGIRVDERRLPDGTIQVTPDHLEPIDLSVTPRVLMLDIEVDDRRGFPEDGEEPIVCLATHDSHTNEYTAWLHTAPNPHTTAPRNVSIPDQLDGDANTRLRVFDTEQAMLDTFLTYLDETPISVICGWNVDDFDVPYLLDRLDTLGMDSNRLSRINEVWRTSSGWGTPNVKGYVIFDLLYGYQRTQFSELDSYRLDDVAHIELGVRKERYPGNIGDLWEQNPERLLEYNLRDVELCVEIDRKQGIIAFWDEVRKFVGCKLEDAPTPGDAVDMYVLHKAHGKFALPTKGQQEGEEFEGGAVFDPITGVKEVVSVLDLASLYPLAMVTLNASPETKVDPQEYDGETHVSPDGQHYRKEPDGIMREMVDELLTEREHKKQLRDHHDPSTDEYTRYDRQQAGVKVIMNCFTPDTEVLTPDGVRCIVDLGVGDEVYSLNPETMEMEVKPVVDTHAYPDYRGELVEITAGGVDFRLTPNHRLFVRETRSELDESGTWAFVQADSLSEDVRYELPGRWVFGRRVLAQSEPKAARERGESGVRMVGDGGVSLPDRNDVPADAGVDPDGTGERGSMKVRIETHTVESRDRLLARCVEAGLTPAYTRVADGWEVTGTIGRATFRSDRDVSVTTADDGVYCVTVADNHTLVAGRNGQFQVVGQSLYGVSGWERFRLYDRENAAAITATGRELIRFTERAAAEIDKEVIYGDTDSIMLEFQDVLRGSAPDLPVPEDVRESHPDMSDEELRAILLAIDESFEVEDHINSRYDAFARDVLNAEFHRFEIEFEKLYRRFFQAGRKKRYAGHVVWQEGVHVDSIDITGFEYKRSDIAPLTKRVQERVLEMIVHGAEEDDITAYVGEVIQEFDAGDVDLEEIAIPGGIGKRLTEYDTDTAHVRGAKYANAVLGTNFDRGSKPKRVYLERVEPSFFREFEAAHPGLFPETNAMDQGPDLDPMDRYKRGVYTEFRTEQDVICFEYADQVPGAFQVDYEKMLDRTLRGPIERILEAMDISWEEVKTGQQQTGLSQYW